MKIMMWGIFLSVYTFYVVVYMLKLNQPSRYYSFMSPIQYMKHYTNLVPFQSFQDYIMLFLEDRIKLSDIIKNIAGNFILFAPLGFVLPSIFPKIRSIKDTIWVTFLVSIFFEILQLILQIGSFDIDDCIIRIVGTIMGYGIYQIVSIILKK